MSSSLFMNTFISPDAARVKAYFPVMDHSPIASVADNSSLRRVLPPR
jgi:hypothetical protein